MKVVTFLTLPLEKESENPALQARRPYSIICLSLQSIPQSKSPRVLRRLPGKDTLWVTCLQAPLLSCAFSAYTVLLLALDYDKAVAAQ